MTESICRVVPLGLVVDVNYDLTVERLVRLGRYYDSSSFVTSDNYPSSEKGKAEIVVDLLKFEGVIKKVVEEEMTSLNYYSATLKELLSLGAQFPDLQRRFWVAAIGSTRPFKEGVYAPYLSSDRFRTRFLSEFWMEENSKISWHVAAVRI